MKIEGSAILDSNEKCKDECEFTVHPCNFKVEIKEIKPFYVYSDEFILLDLKVINRCNTCNFIKIESHPVYGKLILVNSSTLIYKPTRIFSGYDMFQIVVEDEFGVSRIESVLIRIICK